MGASDKYACGDVGLKSLRHFNKGIPLKAILSSTNPTWEKWFLPRLLTWHSSEKTLPWKLLHSILPIKNDGNANPFPTITWMYPHTQPVTNEGLPGLVVAWQQKRRAPKATGGCQHLGERFFHDLHPLLITQHHPNVPPLETKGLIRLFFPGGWLMSHNFWRSTTSTGTTYCKILF